jgi:hypothetical protein
MRGVGRSVHGVAFFLNRPKHPFNAGATLLREKRPMCDLRTWVEMLISMPPSFKVAFPTKTDDAI